MRHNIIYVLALAFIAVACFEDRFHAEPTPGDEVVFSAGLNSVKTKTLYGKDIFDSDQNGIKVKWVDGDVVKIYGASCDRKQAEYSIVATATNTPNQDDGKTTADDMVRLGEAGVQWGTASESEFYAVYPSSATQDFVTYNGGVQVKTTIGSTQYNRFIKSSDNVWQGVPFDFSDKSMRMNNAIMYARTTVANGNSVDLDFNPYSTVLKFQIASWTADGQGSLGAPAGKTVQIKSITITAPYPIAGDFDLRFPSSSKTVEAVLKSGYNTSKSIVITPAEQLVWAYNEMIEFSVFTIPIAGRNLSDVVDDSAWTIKLETNDGAKTFRLKPSSSSNSAFAEGKIHKIGIPGIPVATPWEPSKDSWIDAIPRNVYLSELSLPGAWYSTDENYQGSDIGLQSDSNRDGVDDGLAALYNAGIRAFHIDCRLSMKPNTKILDSYDINDLPNLVLACAGTEKEGGSFISGYRLNSIGMTVEDALKSLGQLISGSAGEGEFIEVILTVSNKPKTVSSREYGTVDPTMMLTAISKLVDQSSIKSYLYTDQITPKTVVNDVLGRIILKVNVNATDATIRRINASGPMLISEGSMAETQYDNNKDIMLGTFNKDNTVPMHWSNIYKDSGQDGYMIFHYHQCQDTKTKIKPAQRKTAIWEILKRAKANYNASAHNALYMLGIGGWTDDNNAGKADIAEELSPFVNTIIECMLNEQSYTFNNETFMMYPTPVGAVLMNFALKDQYEVSTNSGSKTYTMNSSTLIQNIINLNAKCPMSRDEDKPSWPGLEPDPEPGYVGELIVTVNGWEDEHLN